MEGFLASWVTVLAAVGVAAGMILLARGLDGYRALVRVADTSTSPIETLAAGEVRVSGVVEPAELTLVSLLQSTPCVYYRSTIGNEGDSKGGDPGYTEERSIGFRVRDTSGSLRVFPADMGSGPDVLVDDPEVAADIAAARASGDLADDASAAWGNAAIPGFGIGRPVAAPTIDPAANPMPLGDATDAARAERTIAISRETLVLAASPEVPLLIAHDAPGAVVQRGQTRFLARHAGTHRSGARRHRLPGLGHT